MGPCREVDHFLNGLARKLDPDTRIMLLLLAMSATGALLYATLNPPLDAPDEADHLLYVRSLYESRGTQVLGGESGQPSLYYWLAVPAYALVADRSQQVGLLAVRLVSVLMTAATVPLAWWTARALCPKNRLVYLGTTAFVALVPGYAWIGGSANNDNLAKLVTSGLIYLLVRAMATRFEWWCVLGLVALAGAGVATKSSVLPAISVVCVVLLGAGVFWAFRRKAIPIATVCLAAVFLLPLLLGGPFKTSLPAAYFGIGAPTDPFARQRIDTFLSNLDVSIFAYQFRSFWATFSNDSLQAPIPVYWGLAVLCFLAVVGLMLRLGRAVNSLRRRPREARMDTTLTLQILVLVALVLLQWLVVFYRFYSIGSVLKVDQAAGWDASNMSVTTTMLGRYLYPTMVPLGFLFAWGLAALCPRRWTVRATLALSALFLAFNWLALGVLVGGYYSWQR